MKRLIALALLALPAWAQINVTTAPCKMTDGSCGSPTFATMTAPTGCASGYVPYFDASLKLVCSPTVYAPATDTTTSTGTIVARNVTASGLATPGSITVTPTLTQVGSITTVAGSALVDGDYFTIKYDGGTVPIQFDLSPGDGATGGMIPLLFTAGDSADTIRDNIILTLNAAAPTKLTASSGGAATVSIVLDTPGADASATPNTENVADAGFAVTGFSWPTAATTYTYKLVARLADGSTTEAGAASSTAAGHATLSASNYNALSWSAVTGAASYDVYKTVGGTTGKIASATTALSLNDTGLAGGGETAPTVDGTGVVTADAVALPSAGTLNFSTDLGLARAAAGVLKVTNGSTGEGCLQALDYGIGGYVQYGALGASAYIPASLYVAGSARYASSTDIAFSSDTTAWHPPDVGLARSSAGVLKVTDGSTGTGKILVTDANAYGVEGVGGRWGVGESETGYTFLKSYGSIHLLSTNEATTTLGARASATPVAQTLQAQGGSGTDIAGANLTIQSGAGTSDATGSSLIFKTPADSGSTGTTTQTQVARVTIKELHINLRLGDIAIYANNAAALAGGLVAGDLYRTGADPDPVMIVH